MYKIIDIIFLDLDKKARFAALYRLKTHTINL